MRPHLHRHADVSVLSQYSGYIRLGHAENTHGSAAEVSRPAWTISEVVERTGTSRSTIRRYRDAEKFPHAYKDSGGVWRVPLEDLLAAGLKIVDPTHAEQVSTPSEQAQLKTEDPARMLRERVSELERALAVEHARNEGLERLAQAAQENARDLRQALRMLEVSRPEQTNPDLLSTVTEHPVNTSAGHPMNLSGNGIEQPVGPGPRASWLSRFKRPKT